MVLDTHHEIHMVVYRYTIDEQTCHPNEDQE